MFQITNYIALGLLIFIPYAFYISIKSLADLPAWRKWSAFTLRCGVIVLLVLALAGFMLVLRVDRLCVIFAVDMSNSIPKGEIQRALGFIRRSIDGMKDEDQVGIIVFGGNSYVQIPPKIKPEITKLSNPSSDEYTNIEEAVKTAKNLFPDAIQKRIVLISDGNENAGNVIDQASLAKSIQIYTVPLSTIGEGLKDVLIENLMGPGSVNLGRTFEIRGVLRSTVDTTARLKLFGNKNYLSEIEVELSADKSQTFSFPQRINTEGTYTYEVVIEPSIDNIRENNQSKVLVVATGRPKILYISPDNTNEDYLYRVLSQKGMEITWVSNQSGIPTTLAELQNYSAIIFNNIPAFMLSAGQMKMIERYVHDLGGGFAMIGGDNSFGNGGYYKTPIEDTLPVKMIPERKKRSLSIVLAIDRSGSMTIANKISLAKEAATSVVELLTDKDQIGIIAFDAKAEEVVRLEKVKSKGKIEDSIGKIRSGGGTNIFPAIDMAYRWLREADTQLKHLIIVSDGRSQQPEAAYPLVKEMAQRKITISSIVIGDDADRKAMKTMADMGLGRYYETDDAGSLPRIFVKEAFMASELIMEGDFRPVISEKGEILSGINQLPPIYGYVGTSLKETASVLINSDISDTPDPILAVWQYGLGKSLAFTSDAKTRWAVEWLKWEDFSKLWSQAVGWMLAVPSGEFNVLTSIFGGKGQVTIDAIDTQGLYRNFLDFQAKVIKPDLSTETLQIKQSEPGRYEGEYSADQTGTYLLNVSEIKDDKIAYSQTTGAVTPYSPEYSTLKPNYSLLETLATTTGGIFKPSADEIGIHNQAGIREMRVIWPWLVLTAIPLFFLDVIIRRVTFSKEQFQYLRNRYKLQDSRHKVKMPVSPALTPKQATLSVYFNSESATTYTSRLLTAKKRAKPIIKQNFQ